MFIEHFIYGIFEDDYDTVKSDGVETLLSKEALNYLEHIGDHLTEEKDIYNILEGVLAVSFISFKRDRYHRPTVWNHTFLVWFEDYLKYVQLFNIFRPHIILSYEKKPSKLEPIKIGE